MEENLNENKNPEEVVNDSETATTNDGANSEQAQETSTIHEGETSNTTQENNTTKEEEAKTENQQTVLNGTVIDEQEEFTKEDIDANKVMAILCYIIPLIPYVAEKKSKWVRFHAVQGMNLWLLGIIASVVITTVSTIFSFIPILGWIVAFVLGVMQIAVSLGSFALVIIGIMNVCNGEAKELPLIEKIKIVKK